MSRNDAVQTDPAILRAIEARDPDGGTEQPSAAAYAAFRAGVIADFGWRAWHDYSPGGWDGGYDE
jgi:hypothetical protein